MLVDEYNKKFNESRSTEPSTYTENTWCLILTECIKQWKTISEQLEIEQNFNSVFHNSYEVAIIICYNRWKHFSIYIL